METSNYIAIGAMIISVVSVGFSFYSARQAKRQADAVLGDVPASFGAYQISAKGSGALAEVSIEIMNHNRKALLLHRIWLEYPAGVQVLQQHKTRIDLINDILDRALTGEANYKFDIPYRLRGCGANTKPHDLIMPFDVKWQNPNKKQCFSLYFGCEFSYESRNHIEAIYLKLDVSAN